METFKIRYKYEVEKKSFKKKHFQQLNYYFLLLFNVVVDNKQS